MATKIEWTARPGTTGETWNPVTGCTKISPGCKHCYAERMAKRLAGRFGYPAIDPFKVTLHEDKLEQPLRWRKPRTVFVCSMGDLFHEDIPHAYRTDIFDVMASAEALRHTFLVLTKRPEKINAWVNWMCEHWPGDSPWNIATEVYNGWPPNVIPGVTAENQEQANLRIPVLLRIPAAVHFVSIEPMLGPVIIDHWLGDAYSSCHGGFDSGLDWVIVGGETGPRARRMDCNWALDVVEQCQGAEVPVFVKHLGTANLLSDYSGADMSEWPEVLRVRQWPVLL